MSMSSRIAWTDDDHVSTFFFPSSIDCSYVTTDGPDDDDSSNNESQRFADVDHSLVKKDSDVWKSRFGQMMITTLITEKQSFLFGNTESNRSKVEVSTLFAEAKFGHKVWSSSTDDD